MQGKQRKIRCRVLTQPHRNPCSNEALDESGVCLRHLEEITAHWCDVLADKTSLLGAETAGHIREVLDTLRRYT